MLFDLNGILRGDNLEEVFVDLVCWYVVFGVLGVVLKFLLLNIFGEYIKGILVIECYIIKGMMVWLFGIVFNEYLCMEVLC